MVAVAERAEVLLFAAAVTATVPLPIPFPGETESQLALLVALHCRSELEAVTVTDWLEAPPGNANDAGETSAVPPTRMPSGKPAATKSLG